MKAEGNKVQLADWQQMKCFLELGFGESQEECCKPCFSSRCSSLSVYVAAIVGEIYSEISLLTPGALVLSERPVKLMGQIQSFLVTHFTTHAHTRAHTLQLFFFRSLSPTNIGPLPLLRYRPARHQDVVSASQEI